MSESRNKLYRAQSRLRPKAGASENVPTIDDQLTRLEDDIRRLKIEFDVFFNGGSKRPPYDTKGRVETVIKRLGDDRTLNYAQRYRYGALASRYNSFRDLWRRTMQGREEGRDAGAVARAQAKQEAVASFNKVNFVCGDAHKDVETVKGIYNALVDAKKLCGESTDDFSFPRFHRLLASQADGLKDRLGCDTVSFSIEVSGGHVSFKARGERT